MAGKDTELVPAGPLTGAEVVAVVQGGVSVQTTLGDIAALGGGGGGGVSVGVQFTAALGSTADSDPGPGLLIWNHATQASATQLFLDDTTADGASLTGWWSALEAGGFCYLQHGADQNIWQVWEITAVTDATGYVKLGVALVAKGADFADGDPMLVTLQQGLVGGGSAMWGAITGTLSAQADLMAALNKVKNQSIQIACSDETTALAAGAGKVTFRMPYAFTLTGVRASVTTAPTGSVLTVDINEGGVSILSTKLTIDATEKTSTTAATAPVISDTSLADDAEITIDIDGVGSTIAGTGLKVTLIGYAT